MGRSPKGRKAKIVKLPCNPSSWLAEALRLAASIIRPAVRIGAVGCTNAPPPAPVLRRRSA